VGKWESGKVKIVKDFNAWEREREEEETL